VDCKTYSNIGFSLSASIHISRHRNMVQ